MPFILTFPHPEGRDLFAFDMPDDFIIIFVNALDKCVQCIPIEMVDPSGVDRRSIDGVRFYAGRAITYAAAFK